MSGRDTLAEAEKPIWDSACAFFERMLNDFSSKNMLRKTHINKEEKKKLIDIWGNSREFGLALNFWVDNIKNDNEDMRFPKEIDLPPDLIAFIVYSQLVGTTLFYIEAVFKTSLLFFLKEEKAKKGE